MSERPPLPMVLTGWQAENLAATLKRVKDVFAERYPGVRCLVRASFQSEVGWEISHHHRNECTTGSGWTLEEAFADLDTKLGPPMTEMERLKWRCEQLMQDAVAMHATEIVNALKAAQNNSPAEAGVVQ